MRAIWLRTLAFLAIPRSTGRADGVGCELGVFGDGQRAIVVAVVAAAGGQRRTGVCEDGDGIRRIEQAVEDNPEETARNTCPTPLVQTVHLRVRYTVAPIPIQLLRVSISPMLTST